MKFALNTQKVLYLLVAIFISIWLILFTIDGFAHSGGEAIGAPRRGDIIVKPIFGLLIHYSCPTYRHVESATQ